MKPKAEKMKDLGRVRRRKIIIQKKTYVQNELGDLIAEWPTWQTLWAERGSLWGDDYYAAAAIDQENTVEFVVKWFPSLDEINTADYRIKFDNDIYDIKHVDTLRDDGMFIKIKALARD